MSTVVLATKLIGLGWVIVTPIVLLTGLGWWLDLLWGSAPALTVSGVLLGTATGLAAAYRLLKTFLKPTNH